MKTITAFQTSDGKVFTSDVDAKRHEKFLEHRDVVEEFLKSDLNKYQSAVQKNIARNTITYWEIWKTQNSK
jgi:hypothetical protein